MFEMTKCQKMTPGQIIHIVDAMMNDKPIQWKSRWFPVISSLATPHAPEGETLVEWNDMTDDRDHPNFADYLYRVKP